MSIEQLKLYNDQCDFEIEVYSNKFKVGIVTLTGYETMYLDRSQAHLLMLYLQEHLK